MADKPLRLLVGTDFSRESKRALATARALAARSGGKIVLAHTRPVADMRAAVVEERGDLISSSPPGGLKIAMAGHYEKRLKKLVRDGESWVVLKGEPARELAKEAARGYDYLVIATRGLGGAASLLLGSTARAILWHAKTPVIVVPARR
jgi:nucleotide-binding universal stress UspA family protein